MKHLAEDARNVQVWYNYRIDSRAEQEQPQDCLWEGQDTWTGIKFPII